MDERNQQAEEEIVRRLLEEAGPRPPIPQEDLDAISTAARSAWRSAVQGPPRRRRPLREIVLAMAAALILAVGLAWWWQSRAEPLPPAPRTPPAVARIEAVTGPVHLGSRLAVAGDPVPLGAVLWSGAGERSGRASLRLTDGAVVRLDVDTRLRLASATDLDLERGALYVDTGPRAPGAAGLAVRTPLGTARDVGTQFTVRILGPEKLLVRVREGAVRTEHRNGTHLTPAGQELILRQDGTAESRAAATHGPEWQWVLEASAGFAIEGRSLQDFLGWVSRETGWRIVYADAGLADAAKTVMLHGGLGGLRPDRAPFAVLPGAGLAGELKDGRLIIRRLR